MPLLPDVYFGITSFPGYFLRKTWLSPPLITTVANILLLKECPWEEHYISQKKSLPHMSSNSSENKRDSFVLF